MTFDKAKQLTEELELVKFRYPSKHCKKPRVLVLDANYPGKKNEKHYGERLAVMGVNIIYAPRSERKRKQKALSEIDLFSDFLGADKLEKYRRIREFYPEALPYIRRYKKEKMKNVKLRRGFFYHPYSFSNKTPDLDRTDDAE